MVVWKAALKWTIVVFSQWPHMIVGTTGMHRSGLHVLRVSIVSVHCQFLYICWLSILTSLAHPTLSPLPHTLHPHHLINHHVWQLLPFPFPVCTSYPCRQILWWAHVPPGLGLSFSFPFSQRAVRIHRLGWSGWPEWVNGCEPGPNAMDIHSTTTSYLSCR